MKLNLPGKISAQSPFQIVVKESVENIHIVAVIPAMEKNGFQAEDKLSQTVPVKAKKQVHCISFL